MVDLGAVVAMSFESEPGKDPWDSQYRLEAESEDMTELTRRAQELGYTDSSFKHVRRSTHIRLSKNGSPAHARIAFDRETDRLRYRLYIPIEK